MTLIDDFKPARYKLDMNSEPLDALITVHYDTYGFGDFMYENIQDRIKEYDGKPVLNLSTKTNPEKEEGVISIPALRGSTGMYGLDGQIQFLIEYIRENEIESAEVVGASWPVCVDKVREFLEPITDVDINLDYTDMVEGMEFFNTLIKMKGEPCHPPSSDMRMKHYKWKLNAPMKYDG